MASLGGEFDATDVAPKGDISPIPAGEYRCAIVKSEWKSNSKNTGKYLEFAFQVLEGQYANRLVFSRLNLDNPSSQAVEIARSELSAICHATNKIKLRDSSELHDIPLVVSVGVKKREDNGEPANEVKGYKSVRSASESKQSVAAGASASSSGKPAWA